MAGAPTAGVDEVVVTALKRDTNIQQTPITISAASGDTLAKAGGGRERGELQQRPVRPLFRDQRGLIAAVATSIAQKFSDGLDQIVPAAFGSKGLLGALSYYFDNALENPIEAMAVTVLRSESHRYSSLQRVNVDINQLGVASLERHLRSAVERDEIDGGIDISRQAVLIQATLRGILSLWLANPAGIALEPLRLRLAGTR